MKILAAALGVVLLAGCSSFPRDLPTPQSFAGESMAGPFITWTSNTQPQPGSWVERNAFWEEHTRSIVTMQITSDQGLVNMVLLVRSPEQEIILVSHHNPKTKEKYSQSWIGPTAQTPGKQVFYNEGTTHVQLLPLSSQQAFLEKTLGFKDMTVSALWEILTPNTKSTQAWRMTSNQDLLSQRQDNWQANYAQWSDPNEGPKSPASVVLGQKGKIWSIRMQNLMAYRVNEGEKNFPYASCLVDLLENPEKVHSKAPMGKECKIWNQPNSLGEEK